jgi:hypothetical protein
MPHIGPDGVPIENPLDLELGHIKYQIAALGVRVSEWTKNKIELFSSIRNKLAHLEPIDQRQLLELRSIVRKA